MTTNWSIAALIYMMVNAVLFGIGAVAVLAIPALSQQAAVLMPAVIAGSFILALPISYYVAPMMRSRYQRRMEVQRRADEDKQEIALDLK